MSSPPGYDALLHDRAFVLRTDRAVLRVRGADRVTWLQGLVTNDVLALSPGGRVYSAWLTAQGRMITDLWIVAGSDALLLDVPAGLASSLAARLDGLVFAEDIQIDDLGGRLAVVQVFGASPARTGSAIVVPDRTYGRSGHVAYVPVDETASLFGDGTAAEVPFDTLEVVRVEAGVPRFSVDMTEDTIPLEAGIEDRAISFTKGCYVGQEIIVRVTTRGGGRVARRLVGLRFDEVDRPPAPGAAIVTGDKPPGRLTSAVYSPRCAAVIGLGYVHRDAAQPGTEVVVRAGDSQLDARIHALPFVAPGP